jgi:hypothetical protein
MDRVRVLPRQGLPAFGEMPPGIGMQTTRGAITGFTSEGLAVLGHPLLREYVHRLTVVQDEARRFGWSPAQVCIVYGHGGRKAVSRGIDGPRTSHGSPSTNRKGLGLSAGAPSRFSQFR